MYAVSSTDDLLSFSDAAAQLPSRPHIGTLHRWRLHGIRGIRLVTVKIGGRRFVSKRAIEEFIAAVTKKSDGDFESQSESQSLEQSFLQVEKDLDKLGITNGGGAPSQTS